MRAGLLQRRWTPDRGSRARPRWPGRRPAAGRPPPRRRAACEPGARPTPAPAGTAAPRRAGERPATGSRRRRRTAETPVWRATPTTAGMKAVSPGPWTVGGRRITLARTPRSANGSAASDRARGEPGAVGVGRLVLRPESAGREHGRAGGGDERLVGALQRLPPSPARRARRSGCSRRTPEKSWMNAVWMTPSAARAPRPGSPARSRRRGGPRRRSRAAWLPRRRCGPARAPSCPWASSSWTTAEPMNPVAPVTNTVSCVVAWGASGPARRRTTGPCAPRTPDE